MHNPNYNQSIFIYKYNQLVENLYLFGFLSSNWKDYLLPAEGVCSGLTSVYIDYAIEKDLKNFFQSIEFITEADLSDVYNYHMTAIDKIKKLLVFCEKVKIAQERQYVKNDHLSSVNSTILSCQQNLTILTKKFDKPLELDPDENQQYLNIIMNGDTEDHAVCIRIKRNSKGGIRYYFYDPNNHNKEGKYDSKKEVVAALLERQRLTYPEKQSADFEIISYRESLICACKKGDIKGVQYWLSKKVIIDQIDDQGFYPLYAASQNCYKEIVELLLSQGAEPNKTNDVNKETALFTAAKNGHIEIVDILLKNKADPNVICAENGANALAIASQNGHANIVELLIDNGVDVNPFHSNNDAVPLLLAIQNGRRDIIKLLVQKGANPNLANKEGVSPFYFAAKTGDISAIKLFLEQGANPNQYCNHYGDTPLNIAAKKNYYQIVQLMLEHPIDLDQASDAFFMAIENNNKTLVELLLNRGIDINAIQQSTGDTAVLLALKKGHLELFDFLLKKNANPNIANKGMTPLYFAAMHGNRELITDLLLFGADLNYQADSPLCIALQKSHREIALYLLKMGINPNHFLKGIPALQFALEKNYENIAKLMIENGADLNWVRKIDGATPLWIASQTNQKEIISLLLKKGADIDTTNNDGISPFYFALENGDRELIQLFLENGVNPSRCCVSDGTTPLLIASQNNHTEIVNLLLQHGALLELKNFERSPLYWTIENENVEIVELLLENTSDISLEIIKNAILFTIKKGNFKILELLFKQMLNVPDSVPSEEINLTFDDLIWVALKYGPHIEILQYLLQKEESADIRPEVLCFSSAQGYREVVELLIEKGANLNPTDYRTTPLIEALKNNHPGIAELYLEHGADPNSVGEGWEKSPLLLASEKGYLEIIKLLIDKKAVLDEEKLHEALRAALKEGPHIEVIKFFLQFSTSADEYIDLLSYAAGNGHTEVVKILIEKGLGPNADNYLVNSLLEAARNGHYNIVELLLKNKFNPDLRKTDRDVTVLWRMSLQLHVKDAKKIIELLLRYGADPHLLIQGFTPFMHILYDSNLDLVQLFLNLGTDPNAPCSDKGDTPLMIAVENNQHEVVELLLKNGASQTLPYELKGITPLFIAAENGHLDIVRFLTEQETDHINLTRCWDGATPLFAAAENDHIEVIKVLLEKGADPNICRKLGGASPLWIAAQKGHVEIAELLLKNGADPNIALKNSKTTPLLLTLESDRNPTKCNKMLELLLKHGADPNLGRVDVFSFPLFIACLQNNPEAMLLLLENGANPNLILTRSNILLFSSLTINKAIAKYLIAYGASTDKLTEHKEIIEDLKKLVSLEKVIDRKLEVFLKSLDPLVSFQEEFKSLLLVNWMNFKESNIRDVKETIKATKFYKTIIEYSSLWLNFAKNFEVLENPNQNSYSWKKIRNQFKDLIGKIDAEVTRNFLQIFIVYRLKELSKKVRCLFIDLLKENVFFYDQLKSNIPREYILEYKSLKNVHSHTSNLFGFFHDQEKNGDNKLPEIPTHLQDFEHLTLN